MFAAPSGSFCGNSLVEKNEECDVGAGNSDKCCNEQCKLKPGALCRSVELAVYSQFPRCSFHLFAGKLLAFINI